HVGRVLLVVERHVVLDGLGLERPARELHRLGRARDAHGSRGHRGAEQARRLENAAPCEAGRHVALPSGCRALSVTAPEPANVPRRLHAIPGVSNPPGPHLAQGAVSDYARVRPKVGAVNHTKGRRDMHGKWTLAPSAALLALAALLTLAPGGL